MNTLLKRYTLLGVTGLLSAALSGCWRDDLGLQTTTPFILTLSTIQPLAVRGESVAVRLSVSPDQPLPSSRYEVSYQNAAPLPVILKLDSTTLARGQWKPLSGASGLLSLRCDSVGSPVVTVMVRDQNRQLQSATLTYTSTR